MQAAERDGDPSEAAIRARALMMEIIQTWTSTAEFLVSESGSTPTGLTFAASPTGLPLLLPKIVGTGAQRNVSTATAVGVGDPVRSMTTSTSVHEAVSTSTSQADTGRDQATGQKAVPRHIALIVLSTLGCITIAVLIWLAWRRRTRGKVELLEEYQRHESDGKFRSLPKLPNQESDLSMTGHTLVPDMNNSSTRTLVPRTEMLMLGHSHHVGRQHKQSLTRRPSSVSWPLRNISRPRTRRNFGPTLPPKGAYIPPTAPPSSPTTAINKVSIIDSHARFAQKHAPWGIQIPVPSDRVELHDLSPVSPLSNVSDEQSSIRSALFASGPLGEQVFQAEMK